MWVYKNKYFGFGKNCLQIVVSWQILLFHRIDSKSILVKNSNSGRKIRHQHVHYQQFP